MAYEEELRLAYAVALNAVVLAAAHRFARRRMGGDAVCRWIDAGLIYYLVQYVVIGVLGLMGLLSPWTIGPLALMLSVLLWVGSGWRHDERLTPHAPPPQAKPLLDRATVAACSAFVVGYALAFIYQQRYIPPIADDALTYHLPAAVQWLQTGRIGLFPTWFFNPANTYSPLGGSLFMAWLIAPVGSDVLVRYVQLGPLLLLFLVILEIARLLGARDATAALVAAACVMTRSFVNQVIVPKDDLFLTAFCVAAVMSIARADERWSPWRAGAAIGLLLATKYTAIFSLPILLLMADAPVRAARWRRGGWMVALVVILAIAAPWYGRNAALTGNALFPMDLRFGQTVVLHGLFSTTRSAALSTPRGVLDTLVGGQGFYGPPLIVIVTLLVGWVAAVALRARAAAREPLWRACLVGSMLSVALFALSAPYAEVRFIYPALALLFGCAAGAAARFRAPGDVVVAAALLAIVLASTIRDSSDKQHFAVVGLLAAAVITAIFCFTPVRHAKRIRAAAVPATLLVLTGLAYVNWAAYFRDYNAGRTDVWPAVHGEVAKGWGVVDREAPPGSVVAYTNAHFVYSLQGTLLKNPVVYVPSKPGVNAMHDLPHAQRPLAGEQIPAYFAAVAQGGSNAKTWRDNLAKSGADLLFVGKAGAGQPPELTFIAEKPEAFERLHENATSAVFRVRDRGALAD